MATGTIEVDGDKYYLESNMVCFIPDGSMMRMTMRIITMSSVSVSRIRQKRSTVWNTSLMKTVSQRIKKRSMRRRKKRNSVVRKNSVPAALPAHLPKEIHLMEMSETASSNAALAQLGVNQDCTMLVTNALAANGIYYHGWPAGYLSLGTVTNNPQPGDLIYYADGGLGHGAHRGLHRKRAGGPRWFLRWTDRRVFRECRFRAGIYPHRISRYTDRMRWALSFGDPGGRFTFSYGNAAGKRIGHFLYFMIEHTHTRIAMRRTDHGNLSGSGTACAAEQKV